MQQEEKNNSNRDSRDQKQENQEVRLFLLFCLAGRPAPSVKSLLALVCSGGIRCIHRQSPSVVI